MPILAVPYLLPFAEAAGIAIAGLGLMELSKQVQKFMDVNPEETFQILKMIMPQEGIAAMFEQLFNKEADDVEGEGEEEEIIDVDEVKDTRSKKEIVLDAVRRARRGKGNYSSEDAEGPAVSGRGNVIRGLEDAGKVDKGLKDKPYKKSKFNYKKYFRKADGGIMDVL